MVAIRLHRSVGLLLLVLTVCKSQKTFLDEDRRLFRFIRKFGRDLVGKTTVIGSKQFEIATKNRQVQDWISTPFPCDLSEARSPVPPTNVNKVRPGDIDVVAAMGDSLTAAVGATASILPHLQVENRGVSWSGGGQGTWRQFLTLPNILKVFNPKIFGYAESDSLILEKESRFNVAASLGQSRDLPHAANILIQRLRSDPRVDIEKHWKLITIMIGANDFCSEMCYHSWPRSVLAEHRADLLDTLRILRDNLPRTIVSLANAPQLKAVVDFNARNWICHITADVECTCLFGLRWRHLREDFYAIMTEWQDVEDEFLLMPEFQTDNFTIVVQPYTRNVSIPVLPSGKSDKTYLSTDCFHLTQKAYARAANSVWNNLMEPVGNKTPRWQEFNERFVCPTKERPYIATLSNS